MTTVQTSATTAVLDGLLSTFRAMAATTGNPPVTVYDGEPGEQPEDLFIQIGGGLSDVTATAQQDWRSLGISGGAAPTRDERGTITCYASAWVGGVDAGTLSTSDAQKTARDQAFALVAACEVAVRDDPKLTIPIGGSGLGTGWISFGTRIELVQPDSQDPELSKGRRAVVVFDIEWYTYLYSTNP